MRWKGRTDQGGTYVEDFARYGSGNGRGSFDDFYDTKQQSKQAGEAPKGSGRNPASHELQVQKSRPRSCE